MGITLFRKTRGHQKNASASFYEVIQKIFYHKSVEVSI